MDIEPGPGAIVLEPVRRGRSWARANVTVAGLYAVPVTAVLLNEADHLAQGILVLPMLGALVVPMALRRRRPGACLVISALVTLALLLLEPRAGVLGLCAVGFTLYTAATTLRMPMALAALGAALTTATATALPHFSHPFAALFFGGLYTLIWVCGVGLGLDRRQTASLLVRRAEQSAAEIAMARAAVSQQRLSIARDLHDVVAHGITAITVQAAYAQVLLPERPEQAREAVTAIETVGRETLVELRQMLTVLREPHPDDRHPAAPPDQRRAPAPTLDDLADLIARTQGPGLLLELVVTGTPVAIPAGVEAAAYRTVQEAITNVVKHAETDRADVRVRHERDRLVVEISDLGRGCGGTPPVGYGLVGMRERALLYGGSFEAGPRPGGGFRVVSTFPLDRHHEPPALRRLGRAAAR